MTRQCGSTTRGCHFDCEFCSVSPFNGKTTRRRPVPEVVKELTQVKRWNFIANWWTHRERYVVASIRDRASHSCRDGRRNDFAFVDDLHNSNRTYCKELWAALKTAEY